MARVNVGIDPKYLADQHLIAESVEIIMITGGLKKNNFKIKSAIPPFFKMGKGHINFFKNKIVYLKRRLDEVNKEMDNRGFKNSTNIDLDEYPEDLLNDWEPSKIDSEIIRRRVVERLITRIKGKPGSKFYRYNRVLIGDKIDIFANELNNSKLYFV